MNCPNCQVECITDKGGGWMCLKCNFKAPKNYMVMNALYCWVLVDGEGKEGIPAFQSPQGVMPMMGADPKVILGMKQMAEQIAARTNMTAKLLRFTNREEV